MSTPTPIEIKQAFGDPTGEYIVELKDDASMKGVLNRLNPTEAEKAIHKFTMKTHGFAGFAGSFDSGSLETLTQSADVGVTDIIRDTYLEPDVVVQQGPNAAPASVPWGLARLSSNANVAELLQGDRTYRFNNDIPTAGHQDVDLYILDSGINGAHTQFDGREVINSPNFSTKADLEPHGTWVASIAAGNTYGVNKHLGCRLINVKVLPTGARSIAQAFEWVRKRAAKPANAGRASVVNCSFGTSVRLPLQGGAPFHNNPIHQAFRMTITANIHVVVSAGNQAQNINDNRVRDARCPSHIPHVITVGGTTINDRIWIWNPRRGSNCGADVTVFAPGDDIIGARFDGLPNNNPYIGSGTSAAAPHVAGLVAYLLKIEGPRTPQEMKARIVQLARDAVDLAPNAQSGLHGGTTTLLASNGLGV